MAKPISIKTEWAWNGLHPAAADHWCTAFTQMQDNRVSIFTVSAFISSHSHVTFPFFSLSFHIIIISHIHCTRHSRQVRHTTMLFWSTDKVTLGFLTLPAGVKVWSTATHYTAALGCLLTVLFTTSSTCSCEVTPPGVTTRSVFTEQQVIVAFLFGVRCPLCNQDYDLQFSQECPRPSVPQQ
jgi:hypothetical protein